MSFGKLEGRGTVKDKDGNVRFEFTIESNPENQDQAEQAQKIAEDFANGSNAPDNS